MSVNGITLRRVGHAPPDAALLDDLVRVFRHSRVGRLQFLLVLHDADEDRRYFTQQILPRNEVWVAQAGGRVVGFIAFGDGWVNHLYVAPSAQGRGVGRQLLAVAQGRAPSLQLWAFQVNERAIRFYERHGFHVVERTDGSANEAKQPDVRMQWDAKPGSDPME